MFCPVHPADHRSLVRKTDLDSFEDIVRAGKAFQPDDASEFDVSL